MAGLGGALLAAANQRSSPDDLSHPLGPGVVAPSWWTKWNRDDASPLNVSVVINCSRDAIRWFGDFNQSAIEMVESLGPADMVSVVVFRDRPTLLVPSQPATNIAEVVSKIRNLQPEGEGALFAGVAMAADEVRKNLSTNFSSKVLVYGGCGTVGPRSEHEMGTLAFALAKEKIELYPWFRRVRMGSLGPAKLER